jgi:hypothetical protein
VVRLVDGGTPKRARCLQLALSYARWQWSQMPGSLRVAVSVQPLLRTTVLVVVCCLSALPEAALQTPTASSSTTKATILSEQTLSDSLAGRGRNCYTYSMDENTTKSAVYWGKPRLYIRLEPCTGMPHLTVSVYGCPSEGHKVSWEFQSKTMRNDLLTSVPPKRVPPKWEWPGDVETLDIDATHKTFFIEVSNWVRPVRTPGEHIDLERRLRQAGFLSEADHVKREGDKVAKTPVAIGPDGDMPFQNSRVALYQDLLLPRSEYQLTAILYDSKRAPKDKLLPMTNRVGFERTIENLPVKGRPLQFSDDPEAADYVVAFWPPTNSINDSMISAQALVGNATSTNLSGLRRDDPLRHLLSNIEPDLLDGATLDPAEGVAGLDGLANPAAAGMGYGGQSGVGGMREMEARARAQDRLAQLLQHTEKQLASLVSSGIEGVSLAAAEAELQMSGARGVGGAGGFREDLEDGGTGEGRWRGNGGEGGRRAGKAMTVYEKSEYQTQPTDLEYQVVQP